MKRLYVLIVLLGVTFLGVAQEYKELRRSQLPEPVQTFLADNYEKYSTSKIESKSTSSGKILYRVTVHKKGKAFRLVLSDSGAELDKVKLKSYSFTGPPEERGVDAPNTPPM